MQPQLALPLIALFAFALPAQAAFLPFLRPQPTHPKQLRSDLIELPHVHRRLFDDQAAMEAECELVGLKYVEYGLCGEWQS